MASRLFSYGRLLGLSAVLVGIGMTSVLASATETSNPARFNGKSAAELRAMGPKALDDLMEKRFELVEAYRQADNESALNQIARELREQQELIDEVAAAKYSYVSGLYWYTDWDRAKAVSESTGKPILSLRLMGKLTDEYSCANSRYFRSSLYANENVAKLLNEKYVLHWKSVRPVPKVTIEFGDGRTLCRTLTGNSIHYVMLPSGEVIDALPGLYTPDEFHGHLERANYNARAVQALPLEVEAEGRLDRATRIKQLHEMTLGRLANRWEAKLSAIDLDGVTVPEGRKRKPVDAKDAMPLAVTKTIAEFRLVGATLVAQLDDLDAISSDQVWERLADSDLKACRLDKRSERFVAWHSQDSSVPDPELIDDRQVTSKAMQDKMDRFRQSITLDSLRNEFRLHRTLHEWFINADSTFDVETLNQRVYDELFLTPGDDPWIGLLPDDLYTGLAEEGVNETNMDR